MDPKALDKAANRLRLARKAIADMEAAENYQEFSDNWYVFLSSWKNVYTVLEQGAKTSAQSRQWFGGKETFRKGDELLQYLFEARNADEHGLGSSTKMQPGSHIIGMTESGHSRNMVISFQGFENNTVIGAGKAAAVFIGDLPPDLRVRPLDKMPVLSHHRPTTIFLADVIARGPRTLRPPQIHLGQRLMDRSPLSAAKLAVAYADGLITEASGLA